MEMGHGDEIVLGDGNFPAQSVGKDAIVVRQDGHQVEELLDAILTLMPLDQYNQKPVGLMEVVPGDPVNPAIWEVYRRILNQHGENPEQIEYIERFAFYERAKKGLLYCSYGRDRNLC